MQLRTWKQAVWSGLLVFLRNVKIKCHYDLLQNATTNILHKHIFTMLMLSIVQETVFWVVLLTTNNPISDKKGQ